VNHFTGDFGTRIAYWFGRDVGSFVLQDGCHVRDTKLNGKVAAFTLGDVLCPDPGDVLDAVGTDLTVRGRIVYLSDRGSSRDQFAIVDVAGVHAPLVVPVSRLTFEAETPADQPRPAALMPEGSQLDGAQLEGAQLEAARMTPDDRMGAGRMPVSRRETDPRTVG
jgi:hypothetical protein